MQGVRLGSCVAISAGLLPETIGSQPVSLSAPPGKQSTPVLLTRGEVDDVMPLREAATSVRAFSAAGDPAIHLEAVG